MIGCIERVLYRLGLDMDRPQCRRGGLIGVGFLLLVLWGGSYLGLRFSHHIVHCRYYSSMSYSMFNQPGHMLKPGAGQIRTMNRLLRLAYGPLMVAEEFAWTTRGVILERQLFGEQPSSCGCASVNIPPATPPMQPTMAYGLLPPPPLPIHEGE